MSVIPNNPRDEMLDEQAAEWLLEREDGFAPERAREFSAWCARDPGHRAAVRRMEQTMALLGELPAVRAPLAARLAREQVAVAPTEHPSRFHRLWWGLGGLAAALLVGFMVWQSAGPRAVVPEHYVTDNTVQRSLALEDGSVMDINANSAVSVLFTAAERRIVLDRGEAHFQVAHNRARPFIVVAGGLSVRAVGTAFDVRVQGGGVDVLVVEGQVELGAAKPVAGWEAMPQLGAGEHARVDFGLGAVEPRIEKIDSSSMPTLLTWQTPMTRFTDVPLRDVITRFNRRNQTQITLQEEDVGERKIGGMLALDQVEAFVRMLEQDGDIVADRTTAGRIILRRAR